MKALYPSTGELVEWMHSNILSLTIKKIKYIKKPRSSDDICINNKPIEPVDDFKFLGVIIDSKLPWVDHIQFITKKISKGLEILRKTKRILKLPMLLILYYIFIYPYVLYCIEICLMSIFTYQTRAVRIMKSVPIRTESAPMSFFCIWNLYIQNCIVYVQICTQSGRKLCL